MNSEYEENKRRIRERMEQLREERIGIEEIDISEPEPYVDPIKRQQEEDIQRVRIRMHELRQQHVQVEPIFSFARDYKRMMEERERELRNIYSVKSSNPFE